MGNIPWKSVSPTKHCYGSKQCYGYIDVCMLSIIKINNGTTNPTRGYQDFGINPIKH